MAYPKRGPEVFEMIEEFGESKNKSSRLEILNKYSDVQAFKDVLRGTFDDSLEFLLPEGKPPFTPQTKRDLFLPPYLGTTKCLVTLLRVGPEQICQLSEEKKSLLNF